MSIPGLGSPRRYQTSGWNSPSCKTFNPTIRNHALLPLLGVGRAFNSSAVPLTYLFLGFGSFGSKGRNSVSASWGVQTESFLTKKQ